MLKKNLCLALIIMSSILLVNCHKQAKPIDYNTQFGIDIVDTLSILYPDSILHSEKFLFSDSSLDGIWNTYTYYGKKSLTQIVINGVIDTSWYYDDGIPSYLSYEGWDYEYGPQMAKYDTSLLFESLKQKMIDYDSQNNNAAIFDSAGIYLGVPFRYVSNIRIKKGKIWYKLLFVDTSFIDGFRIGYAASGGLESRVIVNEIYQTKIAWSGNKMMTWRPSSLDSTSMEGIVYSGTNPDSLRVVNEIIELFKNRR